jgi:hypothetical protein
MYGALVAGVEQREVRSLVRCFISTLQEAATSEQHIGCRYGKLMEGLWFRNTSNTSEVGTTTKPVQASCPQDQGWSPNGDQRMSEASECDPLPPGMNVHDNQILSCASGEHNGMQAFEDSLAGPLQLSSDTYTMLFQENFNPDIFNIGAVDFGNKFLDPLFSLE